MRTFLRSWPLVLGLALVLATFGLAGSATAGGGIRATSPVQAGNWTYGEDIPTATVIGKATFVRRGDEVKVTVTVSGQPPNTAMRLFLYGQNVDDTWYSIGYNANFTTNARGSGRVSNTWNVAPAGYSFDDYFFVEVSSADVADAGGNTPMVSLPAG